MTPDEMRRVAAELVLQAARDIERITIREYIADETGSVARKIYDLIQTVTIAVEFPEAAAVQTPEQVYRDAWTAAADAQAGYPIDLPIEEHNRTADMCMGAGHRAAVDSAYRAARLATAREIAAAANQPGARPAASWRAAMDIIDELGGDPR
jgi:hypothetical protein